MTKQIICRYAVAVCLSLPMTIAESHAQNTEIGNPVQKIIIDGNAGGKRFDGIGLVNGGGATSVLLRMYICTTARLLSL